MRFRLGEGNGTAYYLLGVSDSGDALGLLPKEHKDAVRVLMSVATGAGSALLLQAISEKRKGGRRCSAWRVGPKHAAVAEVADVLHLNQGATATQEVHGRPRDRANTLPTSRELGLRGLSDGDLFSDKVAASQNCR